LAAQKFFNKRGVIMPEETLPVIFRQSKRVILRPVMREDVPLILRWINDPEVTQYLTVHMPMMEADEDVWFEGLHREKPHIITLAVVVDGAAIGTMSIHGISMVDRIGTTGALIGEKEYWGKGYGSEAKMLLLDYAFNTLNLRKVCSVVLAFNERSYRYSLKCGYKEEGRLKEQSYRQGKYWDEILLAVFRDDWQPLWEAFAKEHGIVTP
jgi:RimJ/RimL family protein N-acetyltransferase